MQAAGQIADLGGGALMAAFGIMAALRERDGVPARPAGSGSDGRPAQPGSGEGQIVDVSMADGALSWLAMVARRTSPTATCRTAGELPLAGSLICYRPYECADGWVTLGALEPKFWQAWCRGVGREELIDKQFERPGSEAHAQVEEIFKARTRAEWEAFAREHDCCLEPVLELDEALASELVREREMVVEIDQPGVERRRAPARHPGQAHAHARRARAPARAGAGRAHRGGAARGRLLRRARWPSCWPAVRPRGPPSPRIAPRSGREPRPPSYHFARWCSTTPSPLASAMPPGSVPLNVPNGAR